MRTSTVILATLLAVIYVVSCKTFVNKKIMMITYNVNAKPPKEDLSYLLGLKRSTATQLPDFYAVGLQEVAVSPMTMSSEPWVKEIESALSGYSYVKVKEIKMFGIVLVVMARSELQNWVRNVGTGYQKTGYGGLLGNKGGVAIRFTIGGTSICVVNSHLAAHDEFLDRRVQDYNDIVKGISFEENKKIMDHDYVLWMGDLNFRLDNVTTEEVIKRLVTTNITKASTELLQPLLDHDQLTLVRNERKAFLYFKEAPITFKPTFKFHVGTFDYNLKRTPAWTDRILYKVSDDLRTNDGLAAKSLSYRSNPIYKLSDHKPVSAVISLNVGQ